jgi:hypothetical protein
MQIAYTREGVFHDLKITYIETLCYYYFLPCFLGISLPPALKSNLTMVGNVMAEPTPELPKDVPRLIVPTTEEQRRERYSNDNIRKALEALHQDGFVVLKSVVDPEHVRKIREHMDVEARDLVENNKKPFNQGVKCTPSRF